MLLFLSTLSILSSLNVIRSLNKRRNYDNSISIASAFEKIENVLYSYEICQMITNCIRLIGEFEYDVQ